MVGKHYKLKWKNKIIKWICQAKVAFDKKRSIFTPKKILTLKLEKNYKKRTSGALCFRWMQHAKRWLLQETKWEE